MKPLVVILSLSVLASCAHFRKNAEKMEFYHVKYIMYELHPETLDKCGYVFKKPENIVLNEKERSHYDPITNTISYSGNYYELFHEYIHYLNWNTEKGRADWMCLDEVTAQLAYRNTRLKRKIDILERRLRYAREQ